MIVLTDGKDASIAYCLTTALYCPLPGQYLAIARHKTIRRERKNPHSLFYSSLFTKSPEPPINTGVPRGEEWRTTLHHSSPTLHLDIFSSDYAELTEHSCSTDYAQIRQASVFREASQRICNRQASQRICNHKWLIDFLTFVTA